MLHGTSGSGASFLNPSYMTGMFAPGQPLDAARYYLVIPDNIGTL